MRAELFALPQHIPDVPALGEVANDSSSGHRRALLAWAPGQALGWPHVTAHPLLSRNGVIATRVRLGVIGCVGGRGLNQSTGQFATAGGPCTTGPIITTNASGDFAHSRRHDHSIERLS
jgi:hypothetical protein